MALLAILATVFGTLMSFGYFTQTAKIIKHKSAKDVSLITYLIFGVGVTVWLIYGLSIIDFPIIISNVVALIGALSVIIAYFSYKH